MISSWHPVLINDDALQRCFFRAVTAAVTRLGGLSTEREGEFRGAANRPRCAGGRMRRWETGGWGRQDLVGSRERPSPKMDEEREKQGKGGISHSI